MNLKLIAMLFLALLFNSMANTSTAGILLSVDPVNSIFNHTVQVGSTFTIDFYLVEDGPENRLTSDGLFSFDFRALYDASKLSVQSVDVNPAFDLISGNDTAVLGQIDIFGASINGAFASAHQIHLGSVNFSAQARGVSIVSLVDTNNDGFLLNDFQNPNLTLLDPVIFGANLDKHFDFQITAVPEPSSFVLTVILSSVAFSRRQRHKYTGMPNSLHVGLS